MDYRDKYRQWCTDPIFDEATRAELREIAGDEKEIEDRCYKDLSSGTGGLRGVIGRRPLRGWQTTSGSRAVRKRAWPLPSIPGTCLWNFPRRRRCA